jgi:hypothetical protein
MLNGKIEKIDKRIIDEWEIMDGIGMIPRLSNMENLMK